MNKITDTIIATQVSTIFACIITTVAHLIDNGSILNNNWQFMVIPLVVLACLFMALPYIICQPSPHQRGNLECITKQTNITE